MTSPKTAPLLWLLSTTTASGKLAITFDGATNNIPRKANENSKTERILQGECDDCWMLLPLVNKAFMKPPYKRDLGNPFILNNKKLNFLKTYPEVLVTKTRREYAEIAVT